MATTEPTMNDALAGVLRGTRREWSHSGVVRSENTGMLKGSGSRPDILVAEISVSPVAIETEVVPAVSVEDEARSRLGCQLKTNGRTILSSVAVRLPKRLRSLGGEQLRAALESANDLEFSLYTGACSDQATRHPQSGWLHGSVRDLSILTQAASVPPEVIEDAANHLVEGVSEAAAFMQELNSSHPSAIEKIAAELKQDNGEQTLRMAATMLANALVFQETLANGPGPLSKVRSLDELKAATGDLKKSEVLAEWNKILLVNYWPIFDISRRILEVVPPSTGKVLLGRLAKTAEELLENRLMRSHDLTGAVFQKVIADRKFLAAYYTTPASAALLLGLAITEERPLKGCFWGDPKMMRSLRVADFSCGTGTLLSTAYQKLGQLHELAGGDSELLHPDMMARSLVGCDVLPAAAHLTASMLAGTHPTIKYTKSSILTVAYGVLTNGKVATGSLDLLDPQKEMEEWGITAKAAGGEGESAENPWTTLPHQDFDLVVMNPPFVRATGQEADKKGVRNPMFAAFSATPKEQMQMGKALEALAAGTAAHGNAGLASYFFVLADRKLRIGGTLALVMPLSFFSGEAWEDCRKILSSKYADIIVLSIAGAKSEEMAFSADTGMGECLLTATKRTTGVLEPGEAFKRSSDRATFVVLEKRPSSRLLGNTIAKEILKAQKSGKVRKLEDGPVGGTRILFGEEAVAQALDAPLPVTGPWNPTRVLDLSLSQAAFQMTSRGKLWLPGMSESEAVDLALKPVASICSIGPYHADIDGVTQTGSVRGPFEHVAVTESSTVTYPILWGHSADDERHMVFEADSEGLIREGATQAKVDRVWASRSHCHFNQNFQFNSQSTAMQFTRRRTIGGRAWTSIKALDQDREKALVAWSNTTLGLLIHWQHANKQQSGRGNVVPTSLMSLPVLDITALSDEQLVEATSVFEEFSNKDLLSIDLLSEDATRAALDRAFLTRVLRVPSGLLEIDGPVDLLRKKLSNEPSITGRQQGEKKRIVKSAKKVAFSSSLKKSANKVVETSPQLFSN